MKDITFTFLDLETTGIDPQHERIIEIGILKVRDNKVLEEYNKLINPKRPIPRFITGLTGIKPIELLNAPTFDEVVDELDELFLDSMIVAHNAQFDYSFLEAEYSRLVRPFEYPYLCSVKMSRHLYPDHRRHGLDAIMSRFNIQCDSRHRAFDDAQVIHEFFKETQKSFKNAELIRSINHLSRNTKGKDFTGSPRLF